MRRLTRSLTTLAAAAALTATGTAAAVPASAGPSTPASAAPASVASTATATAAARPLSMAATLGTLAPSAQVNLIGDNYPAKWRNIPQDSVVDDWNMYNRECVSWAAFTIDRHGESASNYGDAKYWDDNARKHGYRVDNTPTPGSIAQTDAGRYGHVAIVDSVHGSTVTVEDYNWNGDGHYLVHDLTKSDFRYLHFYN
ncbi:CHAP domain-containing protein [Amycolatopsis rhabdoformis]|uniref:CHAP domain-containing protein n=1 Tax=Amycolatopsis rhabdoformis TaxID=1448059 RepID=A0ABZ1IGD4_9PSEU|nr:CHAP domain-containing protein [Amycolatopsis rhabdoformis]WSE33322.1 CHAP domain-containing protein [Amycolatopsis rhabdoformis]